MGRTSGPGRTSGHDICPLDCARMLAPDIRWAGHPVTTGHPVSLFALWIVHGRWLRTSGGPDIRWPPDIRYLGIHPSPDQPEHIPATGRPVTTGHPVPGWHRTYTEPTKPAQTGQPPAVRTAPDVRTAGYPVTTGCPVRLHYKNLRAGRGEAVFFLPST